MALSQRAQKWVWGVAGAAFVFALGAYGGSVSAGERGSFTMNYPATGKECGGPSPRELTGSVAVSLGEAGPLKQLLEPGEVEVASHVVTNVSKKPYRIRFALAGFPEGTEAHSRERSWSEKDLSIGRTLDPGEVVDFGLVVPIPATVKTGVDSIRGTVAILDASTDATLSSLPVVISSTGKAVGGDCCAR